MNDDEKLQSFNQEHNKMYSTPPPNLQPQGQTGNPALSVEEQNVLKEIESNMKANSINVQSNVQSNQNNAPITPQTPNISPTYTPPAIDTFGSVCSECGTMHPPIPAGQKCPNSKLNLPTIKDEEIGDFLVMFRNIIISQVEKKNIKNVKKLFQQSIITLTKFLENYNENEKEVVKDDTNPTIAGEDTSKT